MKTTPRMAADDRPSHGSDPADVYLCVEIHGRLHEFMSAQILSKIFSEKSSK